MAVLGSKLAFMYVTCGDLKEGRRVFDTIANEKVFMWNFLMNEYSKVSDFKESVYLFNKMIQLGVCVDSYTLSCVLKCLAALGSIKDGPLVHGYLLKLGFGCYSNVVNSLITCYFKCGKVDNARKLFDEMNDRDVVSWNSMISGYVANGLAQKGLEIFIEMLSSDFDVDLATMVTVLSGCANCSTGALVFGRTVHTFAMKSGFNKEITFNNTLLDMYSKCGDLDSAVRVFEKMGKRSVVSWTSMIAGYAREGVSDGAIRLFCAMEREGVKPDVFAITSILHACARDGPLEIGGYSKNSFPNEALNLFVAMIQELEPDGITMACILPACASLAVLRERSRDSWLHFEKWIFDR
ncbi:hypothetical protein Dsin_020879 [Dipteronia sinensis]|uniref:Pentatricopeptide repeat-containing protein n=1 Tax=Dipteronia sinensis TaxID=43782 RepID=A0AAE0E475_9ROSI|nr:hypothetical protein Dsin_020879 [Dipteronia sinensis]